MEHEGSLVAPHHPTPAERARSAVHAADTVSVEWDGGWVPQVSTHRCRGDGFGLLVPVGSPLDRAVSGMAELTAVIHLTDIAAAPLRTRIRGRIALRGWLQSRPAHAPGCPLSEHGPDDAGRLLELDAGQVSVRDASTNPGYLLDLDDFLDALPDPLVHEEAAHLCHLLDHHPEAIDSLSTLIDPRHLAGSRRVLPLSLDRYGLVLRIEKDTTEIDVRLCFRRPVHDLAEAGVELRHLLHVAHIRQHA